MDFFDNDESQPARILLVDDDRCLLDSLSELLTTYGYAVDTAAGGLEAIERLQQTQYQVMLLDLRMPGVSGHDVMHHAASHRLDVTIIVVSGESSLHDISYALRHGAYDYLKKPYVPEELIATVNNAVRKRRLEDQSRLMQIKLDRSERLHRFIVNNSPDFIYILDEAGNFSFVNGQAENLLGYSPAELLGRHISSIVEDEDLDKIRSLLAPSDPREHRQHTLDIAFKSCHPELGKRYFEVAMWPIADTDELHMAGQRYRTYGLARDITERIQAKALISFQAYHDLLTQLPNRTLFKNRLNMAVGLAERGGQRPAVMFIDLARFKIINDSLGHSVGDGLLRAVSKRLAECIRSGDTLSRFGGDEFTVLLSDTRAPYTVERMVEKIRASLQSPFLIEGHELHVDASIGAAIYPEGGDSSEALIKNAGIAMYYAKTSGKAGFQIFEQEMKESTSQRLLLEQELRRALELNQFEIHYQPQFDTETEQLIGVEALIRWNHPRLGQVSPAAFIPVAEHSRLILEMDRRTIRRACREIATLHRQGWPNLLLSVNLSPLLVQCDSFTADILGILEEERFPADCLELEITENLLLSDQPDVVHKLLQLHNVGVRIAIDDFGTGYSSLSYLQKFPISTLKIDRSFIHNISSFDDACIVNAIVAMAQGLKLRVVAEGVERASQLAYLRAVRCPVVQGFLFSPPQPLQEFTSRYPARAGLVKAGA
ncbi:MAG TPA: EAL domain-containing protein [Gammaproteobacteria bacterium]|nr:EAL domain-containing protein [Gammaproteobacteria bacterium]